MILFGLVGWFLTLWKQRVAPESDELVRRLKQFRVSITCSREAVKKRGMKDMKVNTEHRTSPSIQT